MFLLKLLVTIMSVFYSSSEKKYLHQYLSGDIMIGGLFPIHQQTKRVNDSGPIICNNYSIQMILRTQVMIHAIQEINQQSPRLLPNLTLGYDIYDTCNDVSLAIRAVLQLLSNQSDPQMCPIPTSIDSSLPEPKTKVVIGERRSEVSIAIARIFALSSVTQISYGSTSELLSIKEKFPTFLRTVSSDKFQTKAIYELVKYFLWQSVAIVGSSDEYGKYGTDSLQKLFSENNICVDFIEILPDNFNKHHSPRDLVKKFSNSKAEAIIMFTKDTNVPIIIKEVIEQNFSRTWIAGDAWSTSPDVFKIKGIERIGPVFGFTSKQNDVPGFQDYINSKFEGSKNAILNHYQLSINESKDDEDCNCKNKTSNSNCLQHYIDHDESYSIYLAVRVIAMGLKALLKCDNQSCERTTFTAFELFNAIRNINITVNNTTIFFDENGDPSVGYDILFWNKSNTGINITTIGGYWPNMNISFHKNLSQLIHSGNVSVFNCSKVCQPGQRLRLNNGKCCYDCVDCSSEEYSFGNNVTCMACNKTQYSPANRRDTCLDKTEEFLEWRDPFAIVLSTIAVIAIIVTVVTAIIIGINCGTPIVKAIGGCLCFVELASLLFGFCITFTFMGKPTTHSCSGIHFFGIGFSLCISCILANLIQILQGFSFDPRVCSRIKRFNHPVPLIVIISGVQIGISLAWQLVRPVHPIQVKKSTSILHQCDTSMDTFFVATIVYNSFWGFVCFIFAFKGRQLPDIYKNASLITVSMVLFLIIWIVCLPIILTLQEKYIPVVSCMTILISFYGILGCHLVPKCYIMLFRKELNNQKAISEYIRKHYERKDLPVIPP